MPFRSSRDRAILVGIESTYGVAPSMTASNAILAMDAQVRVLGEQLTRDIDLPYFGGDPFVLVGKRVEIQFNCDLIGNATVGSAAPLGPVYRGCGHAQTLDAGVSATYSPVSANQESVTIDFYWAGLRVRALGCRGSMVITQNIKTYTTARVTFVGFISAVSVASDLEPPTGISLSAFQTPPAVEDPTWTFTIGSYTAHCVALEINQGGETPLIETSESRQVIWIDRKPSGRITVVKNDPLTTWNPWSIANAYTVQNIVSTINGGAGKITTINARAQLGYPEPTDFEGVAAWNIPITLVPNTGDDEYSFVFS